MPEIQNSLPPLWSYAFGGHLFSVNALRLPAPALLLELREAGTARPQFMLMSLGDGTLLQEHFDVPPAPMLLLVHANAHGFALQAYASGQLPQPVRIYVFAFGQSAPITILEGAFLRGSGPTMHYEDPSGEPEIFAWPLPDEKSKLKISAEAPAPTGPPIRAANYAPGHAALKDFEQLLNQGPLHSLEYAEAGQWAVMASTQVSPGASGPAYHSHIHVYEKGQARLQLKLAENRPAPGQDQFIFWPPYLVTVQDLSTLTAFLLPLEQANAASGNYIGR